MPDSTRQVPASTSSSAIDKVPPPPVENPENCVRRANSPEAQNQISTLSLIEPEVFAIDSFLPPRSRFQSASDFRSPQPRAIKTSKANAAKDEKCFVKM